MDEQFNGGSLRSLDRYHWDLSILLDSHRCPRGGWISTWLVSLHFVWRWLGWLLNACPLCPWRLIVFSLIFMHIIFYGSTEDLGRYRRRWMNGSLSGIMGSRMVRVWEDARGLEISKPREGKPSYLVSMLFEKYLDPAL